MHPYPAGCILAFNLKVSARGWIRETINPWGCGCTICRELFLQWTMYLKYFKSWGKHRGNPHSTPSFLGFHQSIQKDRQMARPERPSQIAKSWFQRFTPLECHKSDSKPLACWPLDLGKSENQQTVGDATTIGLNLTTRKRNLRSALLLWHMKIEQINTNKI